MTVGFGGLYPVSETPTGSNPEAQGKRSAALGLELFSTTPERLPKLRAYIADQERHHRKMSFQDEFRRLLKAHDVEYDERYVWD